MFQVCCVTLPVHHSCRATQEDWPKPDRVHEIVRCSDQLRPVWAAPQLWKYLLVQATATVPGNQEAQHAAYARHRRLCERAHRLEGCRRVILVAA